MFQAQNQALRIQQKPDREGSCLLAYISHWEETDAASKQIIGKKRVVSNIKKIKQENRRG